MEAEHDSKRHGIEKNKHLLHGLGYRGNDSEAKPMKTPLEANIKGTDFKSSKNEKLSARDIKVKCL